MDNCSGDERAEGVPQQGFQFLGSQRNQQLAGLDMLVPGFSVLSSALHAHLGVDLSLYIPLVFVLAGVAWTWNFVYSFIYGIVEDHLISSICIRTDDEAFDMVMAWTAGQTFSQRSRRFIANTNLNPRSTWSPFDDDDDDDLEDDDQDENSIESRDAGSSAKKIRYTPSYGKHLFLFRGRPIIFERRENRDNLANALTSEKEEIYISCLGRTPRIIKQLLEEACDAYSSKDEGNTLIYRGATGSGPHQNCWIRCMARSRRPLNTIILNEKLKQTMVDDIADYINPATRRWYTNRGIPYRRGYLLHGPPGTGKSSLSLALAGHFNLRIYILSLNSPAATEETVSYLFATLPRRCVVLLEDIDTAGLTNSRDGTGVNPAPAATPSPMGQAKTPGPVPTTDGRISLSALLNILDGVASQEGRVLIMTTNHRENLDKALIRPGRVDMTITFTQADKEMTTFIFRAIYAPYDNERIPRFPGAEKAMSENPSEARATVLEEVHSLAEQFAAKIPEHEFSPAEIQGLLLQYKRDPFGAIRAADEWVTVTRREKARKTAAQNKDGEPNGEAKENGEQRANDNKAKMTNGKS